MNTSSTRRNRLKRQTGFSLLEMLIVLVIIAILVGLAIPRYTSSTTKAKQTEAKGLLHQIFLMERTYYDNHDQYWIPTSGTTANKHSPYAFDTLGVEIMKSARYTYTIEGDADRFTATAVARRLNRRQASTSQSSWLHSLSFAVHVPPRLRPRGAVAGRVEFTASRSR